MRGAALPVLLLLLVTLTGVAHASLLLALEELRGSRASLSLLRVRLEAESAVLLAGARLREPGGILAGSLNEGVAHSVRATRLTPEYFLLDAEAVAEGGGPRYRTTRVLWTLDPETEVGRVRAGLEYSGTLRIVEEGSVTSAGATGCGGQRPLPESRARAASDPDGSPFPFVGILSPADARRAFADARAGTTDGDGEPRPFSLPLGEPGVRLDVGGWTGVILVEGDLHVEGDARLTGLVVVGGDLVLAGDARVEGVVRVGGDVHVRGRARILSDPCALAGVLTGTPDLLRPVPVPEGSWIPQF